MIERDAPLEIFETLDSTNSEALRRACDPAFAPAWILALRQTEGRGRRGRSWASLAGNLHLSYLGRVTHGAAATALLGFAAAIAIGELLDGAAGAPVAKLKWPNDVLIGAAKAAGVLVEANGQGAFVLGMGVNLAASPDISGRSVTSMAEWGGALGPEPAAQFLIARLEALSDTLSREGFAPVRALWLSRAVGVGEEVVTEVQGATLRGRFEDITPEGALQLVEEGGSARVVSAGEVYFPNLGV